MQFARLALLTVVLGLGHVPLANALSIDICLLNCSPAGGGGGSSGAPAPIVAAGLPMLAAVGIYKAIQRRRRP